MIVWVCLILVIALSAIMLSALPWVQANLQWMTTYKFFIAMGILVGCALLYLINHVAVIVGESIG